MWFEADERNFPIYRLCLLGYTKQEIEDKILFSKTNLATGNPYSYDEVQEAYLNFFTHIYNKDIEKMYPESKKAYQDYVKNSIK